ncbi:hypothetical protein [Actinomadura kijaniata]|uniref:hypothetical protein n=1 Tax=Actinomadura kijaniata TaxID=46161 RepID=UPI0008305A7F|nr:hypothetical protein [Actinomadura kijaniata]
MTARTINDRLALDINGVAEHTGASIPTVRVWYRDRATTGFPDPIPADLAAERRALWFWADQVEAFHQHHTARKRAALTPLDTSGDPTELVNSTQAAHILGYGRAKNLPPELLERADHIQTLPSGRQRRFWHRSTIWKYGAARGTRPTGPPRTPGHHPRRTGDPTDLVDAIEAARILNHPTTKPLPPAVLEAADQTQTLPSGRRLRFWKRATLWALADQSASS